MIYRAIGIMSGSSVDGLDIAFTEFTETGGNWNYEILAADCIEYTPEWKQQLLNVCNLSALDYQLLHTAYGRLIGQQINEFIEKYQLHHKVQLIGSHGHTSFHLPALKTTAQIGDGAAIAAETKLAVVSDLRALDIACGGQGAPIVPIGEKLLFSNYNYFLNLGGIANISINTLEKYIAFDVCAANRVLNMLAYETGFNYDDEGKLAASGKINEALLEQLNALDYYHQPYPKSLPNSFGTDQVFPIIKNANLPIEVALRTYTEHICIQLSNAISIQQPATINQQLLVTGGGAFNKFLVNRLSEMLAKKNINVIIPDEKIIQFKEALIMGLIAVLRWREEANTIASVTGASQASIGGALWLGAEA